METVYATLDVSIKKLAEKAYVHNNIKETDIPHNNAEYNFNNKTKTNSSNKDKEYNTYQKVNISSNKAQFEAFSEKIRMRLNIIKNNEVLFEKDFFNQLLISNFIFENPYINILPNKAEENSNKGKNINNKELCSNIPNKEAYAYQIVCYIDISEDESIKNSILDNFNWEIRIFSSDNLLFSKDKSKEETEKAIKDSWEVNEPGRSELAKTSRLRFLLLNKKQNGEKLTLSDLNLLKTERIRKTSQSAVNFFNSEDKPSQNMLKKVILADSTRNNNRKSSNAGMNNKNNISILINSNKNDTNIIESDFPSHNEEYYNYNNQNQLKPFLININNQNHTSNFIKNFINYSYQDRRIIKGKSVLDSQSKLKALVEY